MGKEIRENFKEGEIVLCEGIGPDGKHCWGEIEVTKEMIDYGLEHYPILKNTEENGKGKRVYRQAH